MTEIERQILINQNAMMDCLASLIDITSREVDKHQPASMSVSKMHKERLALLRADTRDMLDGKIARKYNLVTTYGKFMDPIADKLLVNSMFIILTFWGLVPVGVLLIVICRDIIVDAIRMIMCERNVVVPANIFGKLKTVVQII